MVHVIVTSTNNEEAPTAQVPQEQASFSSTTNLIGPSHYGISTQIGNWSECLLFMNLFIYTYVYILGMLSEIIVLNNQISFWVEKTFHQRRISEPSKYLFCNRSFFVTIKVCQIGVCALVCTISWGTVLMSFTFLYVQVHNFHLVLVRVTDSCTVLFPIFVHLTPQEYSVSLCDLLFLCCWVISY